MDIPNVLNSLHLILLVAILLTVFTASLLAQWIMPKLSGSNTPGTYTLKGNSKTSSIIIRRYEKQPSTDDPFSIFPDSLNQAHEELAAFGSWTNCEDPEPPYVLEAPNLAPYSGYHTFQSAVNH